VSTRRVVADVIFTHVGPSVARAEVDKVLFNVKRREYVRTPLVVWDLYSPSTV
jgi:hypothetical protein